MPNRVARGRLDSPREHELIDHAPVLHRTCERLESQLWAIPEDQREDWIHSRPLRQHPGYRDFPWLVKTLLRYKARLTRP